MPGPIDIDYDAEEMEKKPTHKMGVFCMVRNGDESGTSGTGEVLEGIVFESGKVAVCWKSKKTPVNSVSIFDTFEEFEKIHIGQHPDNHTEIVWKKIDSKSYKTDQY